MPKGKPLNIIKELQRGLQHGLGPKQANALAAGRSVLVKVKPGQPERTARIARVEVKGKRAYVYLKDLQRTDAAGTVGEANADLQRPYPLGMLRTRPPGRPRLRA